MPAFRTADETALIAVWDLVELTQIDCATGDDKLAR